MTAKEYLNKPWELNCEINDKLEKAARLRQDLYGRGISHENNASSSPNHSTDAIGKAVCKVIAFEKEADVLIDQLITLKIEIEHTISMVDDRRYRKLLERRYLFFESFETIAATMNYSKKHIYRLHDEAISAVGEKLRTNATECD